MAKCLACGKQIVLVTSNPRVISLAMKWVHVSRRANKNHMAIPEDIDSGRYTIR